MDYTGENGRESIDHVLISNKRARLVNDVRSYRGAFADTDYYLVIAEMKNKDNN